ncbi:MAG: N-6 DNA methylase [Chloroflexi bacterium]|nr:N-6 DNA methylase [Chloroflexota bacterium]
MAPITIQPNDRQLRKYYDTLSELRDVPHEGGTRRAFSALLSAMAKRRKLKLVEEHSIQATNSTRTVRPDGALIDEFMRPFGLWEAKDSADNLYVEINKKKAAGYPLKNIIFEDTVTAVLYQDGYEARRTRIREKKNFAALLSQYLSYRAESFDNFNEAAQSYGEQIREIATQLKGKIDAAHQDNPEFQRQFDEFMGLCRRSLNPNISTEAVDEMLIQHLMTERIIRRVFDVAQFAQTNVIAAKIEEVIRALTSRYFNRSDFLGALNQFHKAIEDAAEDLDFSDKQTFINSVYEKFFQGYSVKVADTHGIVYTPQEIVDFMCAAVEEVLATEFGKKLGDEGVVIIDPATGTGNFVVNLLRRAYGRNLREFESFYRERLFANEVMLMPYYIASLNIEREYYELTGRAAPFEGLCFVDTLDLARERQMSFFNEANTERVERQKAADINVIIGNPPYNVGQVNENDNNKNRKYDVIDRRIRATYAKDSKATNKNALSDVYVKFFRWAVDRLEDRPGIVCFVSNNSFVDQYAFDGMRKHLLQDFDRVYHLDLHGNVRQNPKISGTSHNVFGIQVGVGITVAVRSQEIKDHKLLYHRLPEFWRKENKLDYLADNAPPPSLWGRGPGGGGIDWQRLVPNTKHTWRRTDTEDEFASYLAIGSKEAKRTKRDQAETIFKTYSGGVKTNRDVYVYDFQFDALAKRMRRFVDDYNSQVDKYKRQNPKPNIDDFVDYRIVSWSRNLKLDLKRGNYSIYSRDKIRCSLYRPFAKRHLYLDRILNEEVYQQPIFFPNEQSEAENRLMCVASVGIEKPFYSILVNTIPNLSFVGFGGGCQTFPFYTYDQDGSNRRENITDWALDQFRDHYNDPAITKWDIFYYVYGLLHHPGYRQRYALDLKRNLPRIPFAPTRTSENVGATYQVARKSESQSEATKSPPIAMGGDLEGGGGFWPFSQAGRQLADLHLNYESVDRYGLDWHAERSPISYRVEKMLPKGKVDAADGNYKVYNTLKYNDTLTLHNIPERAFAYRLGNRAALDWIVDQYRLKTDKRSGITHDPNGYSDDPQYILKLIERVITVSLRTVDIVENLAKLPFRADSGDA